MKTTSQTISIHDLLAEYRFDAAFILPGKIPSQSYEAAQLLRENDSFPIGKRPLKASQRLLLQEFLSIHAAVSLLERRNRENTPYCSLEGILGAYQK